MHNLHPREIRDRGPLAAVREIHHTLGATWIGLAKQLARVGVAEARSRSHVLAAHRFHRLSSSTVIQHAAARIIVVCQRASLPSQQSRRSQLEQRVRACTTTGVCKSAPLKALRTSAFANTCRHTQAPAHDCWGEHTRQTARHTRCVTVAAATRLAKHKI